MDTPLLGEIRSIAINYAPKGWAFCNGQLLQVAQNQALFSLLGTTYGGDGRTTFALPNLQGRVPVGTGQLQSGGSYALGLVTGTESVALQPPQIPTHLHFIMGTLQASTSKDDTTPTDEYPGGASMYNPGPSNTTLGPPSSVTGMTTAQGNGVPHENRMPYLATNFVIALQGIFPTRP